MTATTQASEVRLVTEGGIEVRSPLLSSWMTGPEYSNATARVGAVAEGNATISLEWRSMVGEGDWSEIGRLHYLVYSNAR